MNRKTRRLLAAADILVFVGGLAVAVGVALFSLAAGIITGGVLSIAAGIFIGRGADI